MRHRLGRPRSPARVRMTPSVASTVGASGASRKRRVPMPTGTPASGWFISKAGDSERMRGIEVKLWRGGGQLVAHSSERPNPHGSLMVTRGARLVTHTLRRNGIIDAARSADPAVESWCIHVNPSSGRYDA